jgi:gliding motility-associated-like protein
LNRKLFILTGFLCLFGIGVRAQAPVADFSANVTAGCGPLVVSFKDQSTGNPTSWNWSFGNGQTSISQNPVVNFTTAGTYDVELLVKGAGGPAAIIKKGYITVYPFPSPALGASLTLACAPANIQFIDYSTPLGGISSWAWKFGDGGTSNVERPSHVYTQPGYYNISLTVTNTTGCSNSVTYTRYIRVVDGIQPNFTWNQTSTSCSAPYSLNFINQTAGPGNLTYNWSLGSGAAPASSTVASPSNVSYPTNGTYNVTLAVQSSLGCGDTLTQAVPLTTGGAVINAPAAGCLNTPIAFSDGSTPAPISSSWDFGDGTGSNLAAPMKSYAVAGTYNVTLTSTSATCTSTTTKQITIGANIVPVFVANTPTTGCQAPLTVTFQDNTPGATQRSWDFGDGTTTSTTNLAVSHTYTTTGAFDVKLTVTNAAGCTGTTTMPQFVNIVTPTVAILPTYGCVGSPIVPSVSITTIDGVASYAWTASGGASPSTSTVLNQGFTWSSPNNYSLTLTITTNDGCTATASATNIVEVGTPVAPSIAGPATVCGNGRVVFTGSGTPPTPGDQYYWNFGDGVLDSGQVVSHAFKSLATYNVSLSLVNDGCTQSTTHAIHINPPIPNFGYVENCFANTPAINNNNSISFIDSSLIIPSFGPVSYTWDFGDGTTPVIVTIPPYLPPPHVYDTTLGHTFNVTLTITNGTCTAATVKPVNVTYVYPSFIVVPNPACKNSPVRLVSRSQSFPIGLSVEGYRWQVGGLPSTPGASTYIASFADTGLYAISLIVKDANGCSYTSAPGLPASPSVHVTGPVAKFTAPAGACLNSTVTFTDNSIIYPGPPPSPITAWSWNFGDGNNQTYTTAGPFTHNYADTGTLNVTLAVIDASGCSDTSAPVPIQITSPQALFAVPDSFYCPNTPLTFIDSSRGYGLTDTWNFGDGPGTSQFPVHSFAPNIGPYTVTLSVIDKYNCTSTISKPVVIQAPIAAFDIADTTAICFPLETLFTAHGQFYDSLYWNFGDGTTSTLPVTSHFYNTYDTFYAKLFVQGPGGCLDSATRRVLVLNPNTVTTFTYSPISACDSVVAQFAITPPGYTRFTLSFGDGQTDSAQDTSPIHTYRSPNSYVPTLQLTDPTGCIVGIGPLGGLITVLGAVPFFTVTKQAFCDSATVVFTDYTISNDGVQSKTYLFGDGSSAVQPPPLTILFDTSHFYNTPGVLLATLNVVTNSNCPATYTDTLRDYQTPHPVISDSGLLCTGPIQLLGGLTIPDADTISWAWDLGNGGTSVVQNPLVPYKPGTYQVALKAFDSFGCSDTTSATITINPLPTIKGPAEITTPLGIPVTIPFAYSSNVTTYNWTPPTNLDCATCPDPVATLVFAQEYTVQVTDVNNCTDTASILIKTICNEENYFLPNTFSPNGDGNNDYFYPRGKSLYNIQSLTVFNRWGQMVFQRKNFPANSATMGWDGTFNGHPAPSDAYVYIAEVICSNAQVIAIHGNVTLVR